MKPSMDNEFRKFVNKMSKDEFLEFHIDGLISYQRGFIGEEEMSTLNWYFSKFFTSKEIQRLFKVHEDYPTMDEQFERLNKRFTTLFDLTEDILDEIKEEEEDDDTY